jgi:hypothetical protein
MVGFLLGEKITVSAIRERGKSVLWISVGQAMGARLFGHLVNADPVVKRWLGCCLFPQAGVALGMALLATDRFPELKDLILPVVIGSTVIFEIIGPVIARHVLNKISNEKT